MSELLRHARNWSPIHPSFLKVYTALCVRVPVLLLALLALPLPARTIKFLLDVSVCRSPFPIRVTGKRLGANTPRML